MNNVFLSMLRAGDVGVVSAVSAGNGAAKRLADMGFVRGVCLEMIRPGLPCIVRIGEVFVGLGEAHQRSIELMPLSQGGPRKPCAQVRGGLSNTLAVSPDE